MRWTSVNTWSDSDERLFVRQLGETTKLDKKHLLSMYRKSIKLRRDWTEAKRKQFDAFAVTCLQELEWGDE